MIDDVRQEQIVDEIVIGLLEGQPSVNGGKVVSAEEIGDEHVVLWEDGVRS